uniref:dolichyl-P-Man:Man5GlcNAc2-PP-dolichol alpha-1,3-mannosyltransferase n=1 Tax=Ascaris lumbricoides TaxID=6252 RepID=A0A0M3ID10_ASCLU
MAFIDRPLVRSLSCFLLTVNSPGFIITAVLLLLAESLLCTIIIWKVPYTEIDWSTYMQQASCYMRGIRNYSLIEGDTGPVVYPAGHIFVYRILSALTNGGKDIRRGQYIFEFLYLITLILVFRIYYKSRKIPVLQIPSFVLIFLCCTSYRIHSIFILRLFNDPIAMLLFYIALNFWLSHQWLTGCIFYSYPAGHIFVYRILSALTNGGKDIRRGQYIFEFLYLITLILVFRIYYKSRKIPVLQIPSFVLIFLCCTSYRIHSIFILRLFNDPIAMLLFYIALNFWLSHQWLTGCIFYSLAVSIKMNVLLFAPAVFFILLLNNGPAKTTFLLAVCGVVQLYIATPFLLYDPVSYLKRSFDLGRVFLFKWTVNWRFLREEVFLDKRLHVTLLVLHALLLLAFAGKVWFRSHGGLVLLLHNLSRGLRTRIGSNEVLMALFTANLLGICVARSLHYQFYSWYFHSLPYLLFSTVPFEVIPDSGNTAESTKKLPNILCHNKDGDIVGCRIVLEYVPVDGAQFGDVTCLSFVYYRDCYLQ